MADTTIFPIAFLISVLSHDCTLTGGVLDFVFEGLRVLIKQLDDLLLQQLKGLPVLLEYQSQTRIVYLLGDAVGGDVEDPQGYNVDDRKHAPTVWLGVLL
jgi:hypothetical protein